ncbi:MAG: right-handed parallel beta-helix repeat-containing protein [Candidatus Odinarchaeota archaeon]
MKKIKTLRKTKIRIPIFLMAILALGFLSINLKLFTNEKMLLKKELLSKDDFDDLKMSGTYSDIEIDDLPGSLVNWTWARTQPWCIQGTGTSGDPYIIEGHTFNYNSLGPESLIIRNSRKYFILRNCNITDSHPSWAGLYLTNVTNGQVRNNAVYNNGWGIVLTETNDTIISNNEVYNCGDNHGIDLEYSNFNTLSGNIVYDTTGNGINLLNGNNNTLTANIVHNSNSGIGVTSSSEFNDLIDNTVYNNSENGINLANSDYNDLIGNIVYNNSLSDIYLETSNNNSLVSNTIYDSKAHGIYCEDSDNNTIEQNNINNNMQHGIFLLDSSHNSLEINTISSSTENGIELDGSLYNLLSNNYIFDNLLHGINIVVGLGSNYSDANNITMNRIYHNNESGINLDDEVYENDIWDNYIYDNTIHGISLYDCGYEDIYRNWIYDNGEIGIFCTSSSYDNNFYENVFVGNKKHAVDDGTDNFWNSTTIGNFWDNHTGPDISPHDGIVDTQYNVSGSTGSIDYLPIAEDGAPRINILSPREGDAFNETAPDFAITITEDYLISRWYKINNSATNYPFTGLSGTIDQTAWDTLSDGNITLTFYASDLPGNTGNAQVIVQKDTLAPIITIYSPHSGDVFGTTPPTFNMTITDPNLDTIWYIIEDRDPIIIVDVVEFTIPTQIWNFIPEGTANVTFYANDTLGHLSFQSLILSKNITSNIPDFWIGLDYFTTGLFITLFSCISICIVIIKIYHKKKIFK